MVHLGVTVMPQQYILRRWTQDAEVDQNRTNAPTTQEGVMPEQSRQQMKTAVYCADLTKLAKIACQTDDGQLIISMHIKQLRTELAALKKRQQRKAAQERAAAANEPPRTEGESSTAPRQNVPPQRRGPRANASSSNIPPRKKRSRQNAQAATASTSTNSQVGTGPSVAKTATTLFITSASAATAQTSANALVGTANLVANTVAVPALSITTATEEAPSMNATGLNATTRKPSTTTATEISRDSNIMLANTAFI